MTQKSDVKKLLQPFKLRFPATEYLVKKNIFHDDPLTLIDIGCSGGIANYWRVFGHYLAAYGIDPMIEEIKRLQAAETNPNVHYWAGYIGLPSDHPFIQKMGARNTVSHSLWDRSSTAWGVELLSNKADDENTKINLNRWHETKLADKSICLSANEFVIKEKISNVDFIKIDVDGEDFCVLNSCEDVINSRQVLGFMLEVHFVGEACETDNTFHNTDRFMRERGFDLFGLTVKNYSRKALPAPFVFAIPGETKWGPPYLGDALYIRDVVNPGKSNAHPPMSNSKLLKLVAIYEIFNLPDCAAELLIAFREQICKAVNVDFLLNLLTPEVYGRRLSYQQYIESFSGDITNFYPRDPTMGAIMLRLLRFMWRVTTKKVTPNDVSLFKAFRD